MAIDFSLDEEQRQLQESARRFLAQRYQSAWSAQDGSSTKDRGERAWESFAELGWLALPLPEAHQGLGLGIADVAVLMEEFGRALVTEPYVPNVVLSAGLIARVGNETQCAQWLPRIAQGQSRVAFGHEGDVQARASHEGWELTGSKSFVAAAAGTNTFLVSARLENQAAVTDEVGDAMGLFLVDAEALGVDAVPVEVIDRRETMHLRLNQVHVTANECVGIGRPAAQALEEVLDEARCAHLAEALGCMDALLEATITHTKTREQFGGPLAANQVLRHRLVDMAVQCVEARSIVLGAVLRMQACAEQRHLTVAAAMHKVGRAARFVSEQAVQLHGAMGTTEEVPVGAWLKRLLAIDVALGSSREAGGRYARLADALQPKSERLAS